MQTITPAPGLKAKFCHWCKAPATGTALDSIYDEQGRLLTRMGGRFSSCGNHSHLGYAASSTSIPPVPDLRSTP